MSVTEEKPMVYVQPEVEEVLRQAFAWAKSTTDLGLLDPATPEGVRADLTNLHAGACWNLMSALTALPPELRDRYRGG